MTIFRTGGTLIFIGIALMLTESHKLALTLFITGLVMVLVAAMVRDYKQLK